MEPKDYNSGQGFEIRAKRFQIGAEITNRGGSEGQEGFQIGTEIMVQNRVNITLELISNHLELPGVSR